MRTAILTGALLALTTLGHAATFEQKFYKAFAKRAVAVEDIQKGAVKGLCVCLAGSGFDQRAGMLIFVKNNPGTDDRVACFLPAFTPEGALDINAPTEFCLTWAPLPK